MKILIVLVALIAARYFSFKRSKPRKKIDDADNEKESEEEEE